MAGAVTLCGIGLCVTGNAMLMQTGSSAHAATGSAFSGATLAATATTAQVEPTVVWYGTYGGNDGNFVSGAILRAWSDGTVELKMMRQFASTDACTATAPCSSGWFVISTPTAGFRAAADIDANEFVDGADLAMVLNNWGDAPRVPSPPSACPLNLINP